MRVSSSPSPSVYARPGTQASRQQLSRKQAGTQPSREATAGRLPALRTTRRGALRRVLAAAAALATAGAVRAFDFTGLAWPDGTIVMHLQLGTPTEPLLDGAADWAAVAESALNEWNTQLTRSRFTVVRDSTTNVARGNRANNVAFRGDVYGAAFGERVLAVTLTGNNERDVLFNSNLVWNSYRGQLRQSMREFRRVALHEFGHVLGLDHPDQASETPQNVFAVMDSTISSVESLQADDIAGAKALYDGFPNAANPQSRSLNAATSFTLAVPVSGIGPFTYSWFFRATGSARAEPFRLPSGASYTIGSVQPADAGTYTATATSANGAFFHTTATLNVAPLPNNADTLLANISTRGVVGSGSEVMIAGLVVGGTTAKTVLIRAAGPALGAFGVGGALADPTLTVVNSSGQTVAENDNWDNGGNTLAITAAATRLGAFPFGAGSRDAALLTTLAPGSYTALVNGAATTTGIALVEAYDADPDAATARTRKLVNIATRGQVNTGENVLIAGLVVSGPGPRTYLIRAIGPTLARTPFSLTGALLDPYLQIYQGERLLRENDDWDSPAAAQPALRDASARVGAFAMMETRDRVTRSGLDAAMLIMLQPGLYTAKVSGFEGATGVALVEIYEMP